MNEKSSKNQTDGHLPEEPAPMATHTFKSIENGAQYKGSASVNTTLINDFGDTRLDQNLNSAKKRNSKVFYIDYTSPEERDCVRNVKKRSSEGTEQKVNNENNPTSTLTISEVSQVVAPVFNILSFNKTILQAEAVTMPTTISPLAAKEVIPVNALTSLTDSEAIKHHQLEFQHDLVNPQEHGNDVALKYFHDMAWFHKERGEDDVQKCFEGLARIHEERGDDDAQTYFERMARFPQEHGEVTYFEGMARYHQERGDDCAQTYYKALVSFEHGDDNEQEYLESMVSNHQESEDGDVKAYFENILRFHQKRGEVGAQTYFEGMARHHQEFGNDGTQTHYEDMARYHQERGEVDAHTYFQGMARYHQDRGQKDTQKFYERLACFHESESYIVYKQG